MNDISANKAWKILKGQFPGVKIDKKPDGTFWGHYAGYVEHNNDLSKPGKTLQTWIDLEASGPDRKSVRVAMYNNVAAASANGGVIHLKYRPEETRTRDKRTHCLNLVHLDAKAGTFTGIEF